MKTNLPKRKPTRLKNYDYSAAGYYFVTLCTKERKKILSDIVGDDLTNPSPSVASRHLPHTVRESSHIVPIVKLTPIGENVGDDAHIVPIVKLTPIGEIVDKYINSSNKIQGVIIDKYVIMPDHIHMIIKIENGTMWASSPTKSVPNIIRSLKTLVTKEIGESIFQRSYNDHIIRGEQDYLETWQYIENNPLKYKLNKGNLKTTM